MELTFSIAHMRNEFHSPEADETICLYNGISLHNLITKIDDIRKSENFWPISDWVEIYPEWEAQRATK